MSKPLERKKREDTGRAGEPRTAQRGAPQKPQVQKPMVLEGHDHSVFGIATTPDGKRVVSASIDNTLKIWQLETGRCVDTLRAHSRQANDVAITPDGKIALSTSSDRTLRIWDLESCQTVGTLKGHADSVWGVAVTPDGKTVVSGSWDRTLRVWDLESHKCLRRLRGHGGSIAEHGVAISPDGRRIVSGSCDKTVKVWDLDTAECLLTLQGHSDSVWGVAVTPDGKKIVSASSDKTLRVWNIESGQSLATFEGHTDTVMAVAVTPDGRRLVSGSDDNSLKVWEIESGRCLATLEGHTDRVSAVAVTPDGKKVVSGSNDNTVRVWELPEVIVAIEPATRYTNAKVVLVGESGVGKTGLAVRLAEDRWQVTDSTHGMTVWPLELTQPKKTSMDREVWLWDFAGQPDYRLVHQLYMDETALALMVIDPQKDNPFEALGHWEKALQAAVKHDPAKLLIAARCDRGTITVSKTKLQQYCKAHGYRYYLDTSAKTGDGCADLREAIASNIPWDRLPWTATSRHFKTLKDAIIGMKEKNVVLIRISELHQRLQLELKEESVVEEDLRAVVGLLEGQGLVKKLDFGDFVLLQPEQINNYASAVVRCARECSEDIGSVAERDVLDATIDFKEMNRLEEADEKILLRAMLQTFMDRSLCVREETAEGTQLVFPSYFKQDRPEQIEHPNVFVTYGFSGMLDEIYSTLVVRLHYTPDFEKDQLWKYAADFKTLTGKRVGLQLTKKTDDSAEIKVYFEKDVALDTQVSFIKYVHEHLLNRAMGGSVTRVRSYICRHCDTPVKDLEVVRKRLESGKDFIYCQSCDRKIRLFDLIEEKFASDEFLQAVHEMDAQAQINIDNESRELILIGHAFYTTGEAGQIFRIVAEPDWGIDGEIEFKNDKGEASGKRVYLQLKSGDSYLYKRRRDGKDVFRIKKPRHAEYWQSQEYPVMLVIRTSGGEIRWMNVTEYLKRHGKKTKQIVFGGEPFTALNVAKMRDKLFR